MQFKSQSLFLAALAFSLTLAAKGRPDLFIQNQWKLKTGITFEQGLTAAEGLNASYKKQKGFEKRQIYYDKEKGIFIEQIKWKHADAAGAGEKALRQDPGTKKLEELIDPSSLQSFRSERLFEIDG